MIWSFDRDQYLYFWLINWWLVTMFSIPSREFHQTKAGVGNRELVGKPTKLSLLPPAGLQHLRWPFFTSTLLGIFLCYQVGQLTISSPAQPSFPPPFHARAMFLSTSDYSDLSEPITQLRYWRYPNSHLRQLLRELPVVHQSQSEFTSKHRFQLREGFKKSKWKFKMAFAMKGVSSAIYLFWKMIFLKTI